MAELPSGTVTFLFTDVEGSTRLLHEHGDRYAELLAVHRRLLREAFAKHGGVEVDTQGDAFFYAFSSAAEALAAAREGQAALEPTPIRVRIGIHSGEPTVTEEGYVGLDVHRAARIAACAHGGQVVVSERTRSLLPRADGLLDLGLHRLKDLGEPLKLYQAGDGAFPPLRSLNATNLPAQPSPLVGRERELDELQALLRDGCCLLTLTGAGGTGKTRLALQAGAELTDDFADGVFFVPLQALTDAELVLPTIASTLGAKGELAEHVEEKRMLLLLDNLEQLLPEAASPLSQLLARCPNLRLLVTSRVLLRIAPEREYALEPLPLDDAVTLFRERAANAEPEGAVLAICRRLEGLPLALELAAARTRLLPPEKLLARLERALPLLTGGARDAPERQRTLTATIAWSYELLSDAEQRLFRRLAVFAGGFELEAAEEVAEAELDTLESLLEKSLLRRWASGRLGMLETIREYAAERLEESGEGEELRRRHAEYYARAADCRWVGLSAGNDLEWREAVAADRGNLLTALAWSFERGDGEHALAILSGIWSVENDQRLLRRWLERALELPSEPVTLRRAFVLMALADTAEFQGDLSAADAAAAESLALCHSLDEPRWVAANLSTLADIRVEQGDLAAARRLADESVAIRRERPQLFNLARGLASSANLALAEGALERAQALAEEAVALTREAAPKGYALAEQLCLLAEIQRRRAEYGAAVAAFLEAVRLVERAPSAFVIADALDGLAALRAALGKPVEAARLAGAAQRARDEYGYVRFNLDRPVPARVEPAWSEGLAMTLEQAIQYTLRDID